MRTRSESSSEGGSLTSEGEGSISSEESELGVLELDTENCSDVRGKCVAFNSSDTDW